MSAPIFALFAKPPIPGRSKSRLGADIGPDESARLARAFLLDSHRILQDLDWATVLLSSSQAEGMPVPGEVWVQCDGDLGAKIEHTMREALERAPYAFAVGADSPGMPARFFEAARRAMADHDAVIGPSDDGGFYLLGLDRCPPGLLADLPWSSEQTAAATISRLLEEGFSVSVLEKWWDVDTVRDLDRLREHVRNNPTLAPETFAALGLR